jgi:protein arginine kinase
MLNTSPIDPTDFAQHLGSWTGNRGPEEDVAVSSRVRLARNLNGFRFRTRIEPDEARQVAEGLRAAISAAPLDGDTRWVPIGDAPELTRLLLRERYLCSRDLAPVGEGSPEKKSLAGRAVVFGVGEDVSIMVNEEDHLRLQALASGLDLEGARERAAALDRSLEGQLDYAYDQELGYLTSCPTNVGTGMRASVMLHLPALGLVREELEKVIRSAQRTGLAVRGIYGEGSRAVGDFYQISNQVTLGRTEEQLVADLSALVPSIIAFERRVRAKLAEARRDELAGRVARAREALTTARSMDTDEALTALSNLRLGNLIGIDGGLGQPDFGRLVIQVQKGHVHALAGEEPGALLPPTQRDAWRASFLRRSFGSS